MTYGNFASVFFGFCLGTTAGAWVRLATGQPYGIGWAVTAALFGLAGLGCLALALRRGKR